MDKADRVQLRHFNLRLNEKFLYEYNCYDEWQLVIQVEAHLPLALDVAYPRCIGGKRAAPLEDCGGAWRFMELKQHYSPLFKLERFQTILGDPALEETRWDYADEIKQLLYWLDIDHFDRREVNRRLREIFDKESEPEEEVDED